MKGRAGVRLPRRGGRGTVGAGADKLADAEGKQEDLQAAASQPLASAPRAFAASAVLAAAKAQQYAKVGRAARMCL
jgi:hypothetical protein